MQCPTINEFAKLIKISSPNAAYKVNNLIKKGYLEKIQSKTDRREYFLRVTQKYIDYYNISSGYVNDVLKRLKERMTDEEWKGFDRACEIIAEEQRKDIPEYRSMHLLG